jgi:hypothetical protein
MTSPDDGGDREKNAFGKEKVGILVVVLLRRRSHDEVEAGYEAGEVGEKTRWPSCGGKRRRVTMHERKTKEQPSKKKKKKRS